MQDINSIDGRSFAPGLAGAIQEEVYKSLFMLNYHRSVGRPNDCLLPYADLTVVPIAESRAFNAPEVKQTNAIVTVYNPIKVEMRTHEDSIAEMKKYLPFLDRLSFDGYAIAGGAALAAVRRVHFYEKELKPSDFDFFIYTGLCEVDIERKMKAIRIAEGLFNELKQICIKSGGKYSLRWFRNKNCMDVYIFHSRADRAPIKIQIIFRAYQEMGEILLGFDLPACQWLFDGKRFFTTYAGYQSLALNICPVIANDCSKSTEFRVGKYFGQKYFNVIFPGANPQDLVSATNYNPVRIYNYSCHGSKIYVIKGDKYVSELAQKKCETNVDNSYLFNNDYDNGYFSFRDVMKIRNGDLDSVCSAKTINSFQYGSYAYVCGDISTHPFEWSSVPNGLNKEYNNFMIQLIRYPSINKVNLVFGKENRLEFYDASTKLRECLGWRYISFLHTISKELNEGETFLTIAKKYKEFADVACVINKQRVQFFDRLFEEYKLLGTVRWRLTRPHQKNYGAFNPLYITAREFYGADDPLLGYARWTRYHVTYMWPQKMTIIRAWYSAKGDHRFISNKKPQERDCVLFARMSKHILKMIFDFLDYYEADRILMTLP